MNKFLQEIFEQPAALENTLNHYVNGNGRSDIEKLHEIWKKGGFHDIMFTGMGSSFFAPYTATCALSKAGIPSMNINAGELLHYHLPLIRKNSLLTCISQSGESYEVVKVMEKLAGDATFLGVTNEEKSTVAQKSSLALLSRAGKEDMTSTKTYISTLMVLNVLTAVISETWNANTIAELRSVIEATAFLINKRQEWLGRAMDFLGHPGFVQLIGRGPSYSSVLQGSLMVMEAARNPAAGMLGGEFRHGPLEMSKKGFRAVMFVPLGSTYDQGMKLAEDITRFEGKVLILTNSKSVPANQGILTINIPCQNEYIFPIASIIPLQFIVNQWAEDAGHEPGNFIMGAKVTTSE